MARQQGSLHAKRPQWPSGCFPFSMVGSSFILINKNGRRKLPNTARIVAVHNDGILATPSGGGMVIRRVSYR
jgi:hypothetical protein